MKIVNPGSVLISGTELFWFLQQDMDSETIFKVINLGQGFGQFKTSPPISAQLKI